MKGELDKIICRSLSYECEIGFHACEHHIPQRISVDLVAWVSRIPPEQAEQTAAIRFDYYEANKAIKKLCAARSFILLETLTEQIAQALVGNFAVHAVEVAVTKYPLDMPNAASVSYVCYREQAASSASAGPAE